MENISQVKRPGGNALTRTFAVVGFIALLAVGMWGSVQIASKVPNAFSGLASAIASLTSIFIPADESITLSASVLNIKAGEPFALTWIHDKKSVSGSYNFRYDCADGVYFITPASDTTASETIYCNVPFNFLNEGNILNLVAVSQRNRFVDVTVHIDFTPNGATVATVTGTKMLTVTNETLSGSPSVGNPATTTPSTPVVTTPVKPTTPTPTKPVTPGTTTTTTYPIGTTTRPVYSDPNGYVDLTARIIEVGTVDKTTGEFTASSAPSRSQRIAVRFAVENIGTKTSSQFTFNAVLPTMPAHIFSSPGQQELRPGDRIEFTIGFDSFNPVYAAGEFIVNIDPANSQNEKNEVNNIVKYIITTTP